MELYQIRYFLAAAEQLNFTRAAEACGVSQPSLTRAIQRLEEELGGPLFRREGRHTHLTELGRMVRPRLEQAVSLTDIARTEALDFASLVTAKLVLGCMCTIAPSSLMSLIGHFSHRLPQLALQLQEGSGHRLVERLLAGELDVALVGLPAYDEALAAHPLFVERYVITFPRGHRFEGFDAVPVCELNSERYLRRLNCEYLDHFDSACGEARPQPDVRFQSEHEAWVQAMAIAGLGCAVMPEGLACHPELAWRPLIEPEIRRTVSVVTRRGRPHTPVVDLFVRLCKTMNWGIARA
ncbi:MAG: LysR family transcriptional regulator [Geminicoccaceae bacterium]